MTPQHMVALGELLSTKSASELDAMRMGAIRYIKKHPISPDALAGINAMFEEAFPGIPIPDLPEAALVDPNAEKVRGGLRTSHRKLGGYPWYIKAAAAMLVYLIILAGVAAAGMVERKLNKTPIDDTIDREFYAILAEALGTHNTKEFAKCVKVLIMSAKITAIPNNYASDARLAKSFVINMIDPQYKLDPHMLVFRYIGEINDQAVAARYQTQIEKVHDYLRDTADENDTYDLLKFQVLFNGNCMLDIDVLGKDRCINIFANYARKKHEYLAMCMGSASGNIPHARLLEIPGIENPRSDEEQKAWHLAGKKIYKFFTKRPGLSHALELIMSPAEYAQLEFARNATFDNSLKWAGAEFYASYMMRILVNDFNIFSVY